jgi:hypothetical protein
MIHYEKTYIAIKGHKWKVSCAVIVHHTCCFVSKCSETKNVCNSLVVNISEEVGELGAVVAVFVVVGNEAWLGGGGQQLWEVGEAAWRAVSSSVV